MILHKIEEDLTAVIERELCDYLEDILLGLENLLEVYAEFERRYGR